MFTSSWDHLPCGPIRGGCDIPAAQANDIVRGCVEVYLLLGCSVDFAGSIRFRN